MSSITILPDCRLHTDHTPKGMVHARGGAWVPFFCGNCGVEGGLCPVENMTFAFYLCLNCEKHGEIPGIVMMPDEVFFETVRQEQLESHGHYLTPQEMQKVVAEDSSALATLLKGRK